MSEFCFIFSSNSANSAVMLVRFCMKFNLNVIYYTVREKSVLTLEIKFLGREKSFSIAELMGQSGKRNISKLGSSNQQMRQMKRGSLTQSPSTPGSGTTG